jgi:hypothetical protein
MPADKILRNSGNLELEVTNAFERPEINKFLL